jgi:ectoine hydroxylase-related dioxygenase (phytanoyl-CoA dioxygenase family)
VEDVGTLHADKWFHESMKIRERVFPPNGNALKIWLAIYTEKGLNGLEVVQGSHKRTWDYRSEEIENTSKPRLNASESSVETSLIPTSSGEIIIFNEDLVHVGALNKADTTRISLEITLLRDIC